MTILDFSRCAFGICAAAAMLAGCGRSQPRTGVPGAMPQGVIGAPLQENGPSWIDVRASRRNLLYVSAYATSNVSIFDYPGGKLLGVLGNLSYPEGMCVDKSGNVWIGETHELLEYRHGGRKPINTLQFPGGDGTTPFPEACSIDPTTGDLAATSTGYGSQEGFIAVYNHASGSPKLYVGPIQPFSCAYDNRGNLFADGEYYASQGFSFVELPRGGSALKAITLNRPINYPGGVQWDGKYVVVGDGTAANIYRFVIWS